MGPLGAPGGAPNGPPKSKFTETHRVWCLSLRLDVYYSYEAFVWRADPHGAPGSPQGRPKWAPQNKSSQKRIEFGVYRFVSMPAIHTKHSFGEPTPMGPCEPPGAPKMGPPSDFHPNALCIVLIDSSRSKTFTQYSMHTLHLRHPFGQLTLKGDRSLHGPPLNSRHAVIYSTSVLVQRTKSPLVDRPYHQCIRRISN